jgi:hypothetical protein
MFKFCKVVLERLSSFGSCRFARDEDTARRAKKRYSGFATADLLRSSSLPQDDTVRKEANKTYFVLAFATAAAVAMFVYPSSSTQGLYTIQVRT